MLNVKEMFQKEQATKVASLEAARAELMAEYGSNLIMKADADTEDFPLKSVANLYFSKGFVENCVSYNTFCDRLNIAQEFALPAAEALAKVLNGTVIIPEKELTAPTILLKDGEASIFECMKLAIEKKAESETPEEYDIAIIAAKTWFDKTIPNIRRMMSTGIAIDMTGIDDVYQAASIAAVNSSNGEVDELRRKYPGEALRAARLAFEMKDYTNAILSPSKEAAEDEAAIKDMDDETYRIYSIAESVDRMTKAYFKGEFSDKLVARNEAGSIIITTKSSIDAVWRDIHAAWEAVDWSWEFKVFYIVPLYEAGILTYEELYSIVGEPLITANDAERNDGRIEKLDAAIAKTLAKRQGFKQMPAGWNPFKVTKDEKGNILKHYVTSVYTKDGVKLTLNATSIYAAVLLKAWSGILDKASFKKFENYSSNGISTCQRKRGLLPSKNFFGNEGSREYEALLAMARKIFEVDAVADVLCATEEDVVYIAQDSYTGSNHLGVHAVYDENNPLKNPRFEGDNLWGKAVMQVREEILNQRHEDGVVTPEIHQVPSVMDLDEIMAL